MENNKKRAFKKKRSPSIDYNDVNNEIKKA